MEPQIWYWKSWSSAKWYAGFRLACPWRYIEWSPLAVSWLQLSAATPLWLITKRHRSQTEWWTKTARLSIYWQDTACRLVIPLWQVALAQLYKYHHQSGERQASLKAALVVFYISYIKSIFETSFYLEWNSHALPKHRKRISFHMDYLSQIKNAPAFCDNFISWL